MTDACIPAFGKVRQEAQEFKAKASQGYVAGPSFIHKNRSGEARWECNSGKEFALG